MGNQGRLAFFGERRPQFAWWIPRGRLVYSGTPKTRLEWMRKTWPGYLACWKVLYHAAWLLILRPYLKPKE